MIIGMARQTQTQDHLKNYQIPARKTPWFSSSPIAIGTHLGEMTEADSQLYRVSLREALVSGINFIDTAINYRGMKSERDVDKALKALIHEEKALDREALIVSTKAGIIPGDIDAQLMPKDYLQKVLLEPGIIRTTDIQTAGHQRHVLTPSYYQFAIQKSREHLHLETIDIHYIHNPEISMTILGADAFYKKLAPLFDFYEEQVSRGSLQFYGMATWEAFLVPQDDPSYISMEKVIRVAESVRGLAHHFRFIQMPYHLGKPNAANMKNQEVRGELRTPLEAANELGLITTVSAPLAQAAAFSITQKPEDYLGFVLKTEGVHAAMVGMKHAHHVRENLRLVRQL